MPHARILPFGACHELGCDALITVLRSGISSFLVFPSTGESAARGRVHALQGGSAPVAGGRATLRWVSARHAVRDNESDRARHWGRPPEKWITVVAAISPVVLEWFSAPEAGTAQATQDASKRRFPTAS